jgi:hypothetical protein
MDVNIKIGQFCVITRKTSHQPRPGRVRTAELVGPAKSCSHRKNTAWSPENKMFPVRTIP